MSVCGTAAHVTGVGSSIGGSVQNARLYSAVTGAIKTYKGSAQFLSAEKHVVVTKTPLEYAGALALETMPLGGTPTAIDRRGGVTIQFRAPVARSR